MLTSGAMPKRERYLFVCQNERAPDNPKGCCKGEDAKAIRDQLKVGMVKRHMHKKIRVLESSCLDLCWMAPAIAVMPDGVFYGKVKLADVPEILDSLEAGNLVDRLIVPDHLFDDPARGTKGTPSKFKATPKSD